MGRGHFVFNDDNMPLPAMRPKTPGYKYHLDPGAAKTVTQLRDIMKDLAEYMRHTIENKITLIFDEHPKIFTAQLTKTKFVRERSSDKDYKTIVGEIRDMMTGAGMNKFEDRIIGIIISLK